MDVILLILVLQMRSQLLVHFNWPEDSSTSSAALGIRNTYISPGKSSSNSDANGEVIPVFERLIGNCVRIISVPVHE